MQQFDVITATFTPRRTDDLVPLAAEWIGKTTRWQAAWMIEDGDYASEWAMTPHGKERFSAPFAWVPSGDLTPNAK